jgi:hypothetical protein
LLGSGCPSGLFEGSPLHICNHVRLLLFIGGGELSMLGGFAGSDSAACVLTTSFFDDAAPESALAISGSSIALVFAVLESQPNHAAWFASLLSPPSGFDVDSVLFTVVFPAVVAPFGASACLD